MCLIIQKPQGIKPCKTTLKNASKINPHGLGIFWADNGKITYHNSGQWAKLYTKRPYIAHFRLATIGKVSKDNCHPFEISNGEYLFQNGTVKKLGNNEKTDTQELAELLKDVKRERWQDILKLFDCRFATVDTKNNSFELYNLSNWHERNGIMYSKNNCFPGDIVAVYGTLKKGNNNYYNYLTMEKYIGQGETAKKHVLTAPHLPYLSDDPKHIQKRGNFVEVDVFEVSKYTLERLDRLEGHPNIYTRKQTKIRLKNGEIITAWVYILRGQENAGKSLKTYKQETFAVYGNPYQSASEFNYNSYNYWKPKKKDKPSRITDSYSTVACNCDKATRDKHYCDITASYYCGTCGADV